MIKDKIQGTEIQEPKKSKSTDADQYRVVISKVANEALEEMMRRANEGFDGGEVTRSDIVNMIAVNYTKSFSEADIKALRNLHFNERKMLKALLRRTGDDGDLPDEIKRALREHFGIAEQGKKRASRNHVELSTERNVDNPNAA